MRNEARTSRNGARRRTAAPVDGAPVNDELLSIPRLGRVRLEALAAAGVSSLNDLRNMSIDDLARIKWIGLGNAKLIKGWLDANGSDTPGATSLSNLGPPSLSTSRLLPSALGAAGRPAMGASRRMLNSMSYRSGSKVKIGRAHV